MPSKSAEDSLKSPGDLEILRGVPYHVRALILIGPDAADALLALLENTNSAPFDYYGSLEFVHGSRMFFEPFIKRKATVGDLADYALRKIYSVDVGFRSYHDDGDRRACVEKWKQVVSERRRQVSRCDK